MAPDGRQLITSAEGGTLQVWGFEELWKSGNPRLILEGHSDGCWAVAVTPDGSTRGFGIAR